MFEGMEGVRRVRVPTVLIDIETLYIYALSKHEGGGGGGAWG